MIGSGLEQLLPAHYEQVFVGGERGFFFLCTVETGNESLLLFVFWVWIGICFKRLHGQAHCHV